MRRAHDSDRVSGATPHMQRLVAPPTAAKPATTAAHLDRAGLAAVQQAAGNKAAAGLVEEYAVQRIEAGEESQEFRPTPIGGDEESA